MQKTKLKNNNFCKSEKKLFELVFFSLLVLFFSIFNVPDVFAPPTPHSVSGYMNYVNGTQAPVGVKYTVNNSASGYFKKSITSFPIPSRSGFYSESVSGTDGDAVVVTAWNAVNYGVTSVLLSGTMTGVNVSLNLSRDAEPTVNITFPADNSLRNDSVYFGVVSNLTLFGANATNCFAYINFSNQSVLSMYNNQNSTVSLGSLPAGYSILYTWNISGIGVGSSNIIINFTCDGMLGTKFEDLNYSDTLINITIQDTTPPNITLLTPLQNDILNYTTIFFSYNLTDISSISLCSLIIDNSLYQTEILPNKNNILSFNETLSQGVHNWSVNCNDTSPRNNYGTSVTQNFTVDSILPLIELISPVNFGILQNNMINLTYRVNETGTGVKNCSVVINNTHYFDDYNVPNIVSQTHFQQLSMGDYYVDVICYDNANNYANSSKNYFTVTDPDLFVSQNNLFFNYTFLTESSSAIVFANISNVGNQNVSNIVVQFYKGDPDNGGTQIGTDQTITFIDINSNIILNETFNLVRGINSIFVLVDTPISTNGTTLEANESNNIANNSILVSSWQTFYGNKTYRLALGENSTLFVDWNTHYDVNIVFVEKETVFDWTALQPLGKTVTGTSASNDFAQADTALNLTGYYDSIYNSYTTLGTPITTYNFTVGGINLTSVPVSNSTNNSNFVTGILWDKTDGGSEYDGTQDLVFITITNHAVGKYGIYDYEVKIPSSLKNYKLNSQAVTIYTELI